MSETLPRHTDVNNPDLNADDRIGGYRIRRIVELKEISSVFYELDHEATGARHIHISTSDKENTFGIAFKTVPEDSTGVAHILEHTVLCGSRKFPVRDPFFSMLKRSLNTFMNAFTASDWTMYPFSSQNEKDFRNLMDVYLDAAFFPNLDRLSFKQEGHRLEIEPAHNNSGQHGSFRLEYKGVVYNEMKGAMSSPDQVMARSLLNALYPSTTYANNSGGEPAEIPKLTHDQLKAFHRRHYHPSNAFFYTYGNMPLKSHLRFIENRVLKHFERIDPKTEVPNQPRWQAPRTVSYPYPLAAGEDAARKYQFCLAWLTADIRDSFEILVLSLLNQILLGNAASPLRKALIESGLGSALSDGTGFDADNKDSFFACGLKDIEESSVPEIKKIILNVLQDLARNGIDPEMLESAIHQLEFHRKEITNTPYPYGIKLLVRMTGSWLHGGDPTETLLFDANLEQLRSELARGPFLENRLKMYFLDNPHQVSFTLSPDQQMEEKEKQRVARELEQIKARLAPADIEQISADALALKNLQESNEDLSVLPTLEIEDIPPEVEIITETLSYPSVRAACYEQPTSGIFYFTAALGCGDVPPELLAWVPFFCNALTRIGTRLRDYAEMAQQIAAHTGGIGMISDVRTCFDSDGTCLPLIIFNGKCLDRNQDHLFELVEELLNEIDFSDTRRLKSLLMEYRAGMEAAVVQNGHGFAIALASRNFSASQALDENWHGIHQLKFIQTVTEDLTDAGLQSIAEKLQRIGKLILKGSNMKMAVIGGREVLTHAEKPTASILNHLDSGQQDSFFAPEIVTPENFIREGWSTQSSVSFVARVFETVRMQHDDAPCLAVISKMLRSMYLHREIREKGGAYGGFAIYNPETGLFSFGSYRDPHIVNTLDVYEKAAAFITSGGYSNEDVKEAILQVCAQIDRPDTPGPSSRKAFYRKIVGLTDEARKRFKENLLGLNRQRVVHTAGKYFEPGSGKASVAVISSEDKLKSANEKLGNTPFSLFKI